MNLVIDIGNTRIKLAIFDDREITHDENADELKVEYFQTLIKKYPKLKKAILSTVRDYPREIHDFLFNSFELFIELNHATPVPIINQYKTPKTLGLDRLAAAVGGAGLYPNQNLLIIDAGTAITFDFVSANNEYLGGNISPGLETRFKALNHFTGKLPLISKEDDFQHLGTDTETAIRAGVQLGVIFEVEQYISYFNTIYKNLKVIITGGDAKFFDKKLKNSIFVNFKLTLLGLNRILEYNDK